MFIQVKQGTKHPETGSWHQCTQMHTGVISYQEIIKKSYHTYQMVEVP